VRLLAIVLVRALTRCSLRGLEYLPSAGPALIAMNHLGDADTAIMLAALPVAPEALGKIELLTEYPVLWKLMDCYGTIWLHRGRVDRRALACAVQALADRRVVAIAPEGRYSLARGLEKGGYGAAYVALHGRVAIIPVALTGTDNRSVYASLRRLRRARVSLTVGKPLTIAGDDSLRSLRRGTQQIMEALAELLPPEQRGAYARAAAE
jgi:1-acyl-sn-glycerol-3-phosphate acyltransferase